MPEESVVARLSALSKRSCGVFRGEAANAAGVSTKQLARFAREGALERSLPSTYRLVAVTRSSEQNLHAALLWAGDGAAVAGRSAAERYRLEGVRATRPEIVVPHTTRARTTFALVTHGEVPALMVRTVNGLRTTGVEATLLRLAHVLDEESFEIACEDARRRRLTSILALRRYLERHAKRGRPDVIALRRLLEDLDPEHPARSALEVKARRLLVTYGFDEFVRGFPLEWKGRTYRYDFAFPGTSRDPGDERSPMARRCDRLRERQREMERAGAVWVPDRVCHVGQGRPPP
ncbi:MAG TPA: type IV toxin-antitoxin system AbiEi family antitoxin domain-containing protein [Acidimicrobiia bacterium]|nr:type IV toxin-antitoxin system AbiEi family antitoxin domain-containing protein [Acidimicrobiia bacterium]